MDYGFSGASYVLPLVLGPLGVEVVAAHAFTGEGPDHPDAAPGLAASIGQTKRLVPVVGADLGAVFDRSAERLHLIDEQAREVPVEQALLLFLRLLGSNGRRGKLAFPVTVTSQVERLVENSELEVVRTPTSLPELTRAAAEGGVVFAGAVGGGYVFPDFLPGYEASGLYGVGAPRNTPRAIIDTLNRELNAVITEPRIRARLADLGGSLLSGTSEDFARETAREVEKWSKVVKFAGMKPE